MTQTEDSRIAESAMTVGKLRAALAGLPDDLPVVMATDAEGNDHRVLHDVEQAMFYPDSPWSGDVYLTAEELAAKVAAGDGGWDLDDDAAPEGSVRVALLGPVN